MSEALIDDEENYTFEVTCVSDNSDHELLDLMDSLNDTKKINDIKQLTRYDEFIENCESSKHEDSMEKYSNIQNPSSTSEQKSIPQEKLSRHMKIYKPSVSLSILIAFTCLWTFQAHQYPVILVDRFKTYRFSNVTSHSRIVWKPRMSIPGQSPGKNRSTWVNVLNAANVTK